MDNSIISPDRFEILVVRELRKAGFEITDVRIVRWIRAPGDTGEFDVDLTACLHAPGEVHHVLIGCLHRISPIRRELVARIGERSRQADSRSTLVFATSEFDREALVYARDHGIALLRVVDGRAAYDSGGWGVRNHYPAWLPAYAAQLVALDEAGLTNATLLAGGQPRMLLDRLKGAIRPGPPQEPPAE
jgi:restriction system protein